MCLFSRERVNFFAIKKARADNICLTVKGNVIERFQILQRLSVNLHVSSLRNYIHFIRAPTYQLVIFKHQLLQFNMFT